MNPTHDIKEFSENYDEDYINHKNSNNVSDNQSMGSSKRSKRSKHSPTNSFLLADLENFKQNKRASYSSAASSVSMDSENEQVSVSQHKAKKRNSIPSSASSSVSSYSSQSSVSEKRKSKRGMSQEEIMNKKHELLCELDRFEKRGRNYFRKLNLSSSLDDIQSAFDRLQLDDELEDAVDHMRAWLVTIVSVIEKIVMSDFVRKWSPIKPNLSGWSQAVNSNLNVYDKVFKELYVKYRAKSVMAPEVKLLGLLFGSAFMFHIANSTITQIPGLDQMAKNNPEIISQFMAYVQNQGSMEQPQPQTQTSNSAAAPAGGGILGSAFGILKNVLGVDTKQPTPPTTTQRTQNEGFSPPEMKGPSNVDDILNEINRSNEKSVESSESLSEMGDDVSVDSNSKPKRIVRKKT